MAKIKSLAKFKVSSLASSISSVTIFGKRLLSEEFLDAWNMSTLREEFVVLVHDRHNPTSVKQVELFHHTEHAIILTETPSNGHTVAVPKNTWLYKFPDFGNLIVFQSEPFYFFKFPNSVLHRPAIILRFLTTFLVIMNLKRKKFLTFFFLKSLLKTLGKKTKDSLVLKLF